MTAINIPQSEVYTYLTVADGATHLLHSAIEWTTLTLRLETAGPVAVGFREDISPPSSGRGRFLPTNEDIKLVMTPGVRLYITSNSLDRVAVERSPYPWLEQVLRSIMEVGQQLGGKVVTPGAATSAQQANVEIGKYGFKMPPGWRK